MSHTSVQEIRAVANSIVAAIKASDVKEASRIIRTTLYHSPRYYRRVLSVALAVQATEQTMNDEKQKIRSMPTEMQTLMEALHKWVDDVVKNVPDANTIFAESLGKNKNNCVKLMFIELFRDVACHLEAGCNTRNVGRSSARVNIHEVIGILLKLMD